VTKKLNAKAKKDKAAVKGKTGAAKKIAEKTAKASKAVAKQAKN